LEENAELSKTIEDIKAEHSKVAADVKTHQQRKRKAEEMQEDDEEPEEDDHYEPSYKTRRRPGLGSQDVDMHPPDNLKKDPVSLGLNDKKCDTCERKGVDCHRWKSTQNSCLQCRRAKLQCSLYKKKGGKRHLIRKDKVKQNIVINLSDDQKQAMTLSFSLIFIPFLNIKSVRA
jgi:hypothetical protein